MIESQGAGTKPEGSRYPASQRKAASISRWRSKHARWGTIEKRDALIFRRWEAGVPLLAIAAETSLSERTINYVVKRKKHEKAAAQ